MREGGCRRHRSKVIEMSVDIRERAQKILDITTKFKADEAEAYVVSNRLFTVRLVNNVVFEAKGVLDIGAGIRVIKNGGLGFGSTSSTSDKSIESTVKTTIESAKRRKLPFKYSFSGPTKPSKVERIYDKKVAELPEDEAVHLAYSMVEAALDYSRKVKDNSGVLNLVEYHITVLNSHGLDVADKGTMIEASLTSTAESNGLATEGADSHGYRMLNDLDAEAIGRRAAEMAVKGLKSEEIKEGKYTLILDPEPLAGIMTYISYLISPLFARMYFPIFLDKIGKKIGSDIVNIYDEPAYPGGFWSACIDDEGVETKETQIIEKGVLKSFVYDTLHASMEGKRSTGNGIRYAFVTGVSTFLGKNYNLEPIPRLTNGLFAAGDAKRDEIIEDTKDGLLAMRSHYTRITNPTRGDFTTVFRMGLNRVKNGEIVGAVKKSRLYDNILSMLGNIDLVGDNITSAGSWGNYALVPTIRISKVRVVPI